MVKFGFWLKFGQRFWSKPIVLREENSWPHTSQRNLHIFGEFDIGRYREHEAMFGTNSKLKIRTENRKEIQTKQRKFRAAKFNMDKGDLKSKKFSVESARSR